MIRSGHIYLSIKTSVALITALTESPAFKSSCSAEPA